MQVTNEESKAVVKGAQAIGDGAGLPPRLHATKGRRYVRIVATVDPRCSAFAFIDMTNGDVLKPNGWNGPAKHARGNLNDAGNGLRCIGPHGVAHLR